MAFMLCFPAKRCGVLQPSAASSIRGPADDTLLVMHVAISGEIQRCLSTMTKANCCRIYVVPFIRSQVACVEILCPVYNTQHTGGAGVL